MKLVIKEAAACGDVELWEAASEIATAYPCRCERREEEEWVEEILVADIGEGGRLLASRCSDDTVYVKVESRNGGAGVSRGVFESIAASWSAELVLEGDDGEQRWFRALVDSETLLRLMAAVCDGGAGELG